MMGTVHFKEMEREKLISIINEMNIQNIKSEQLKEAYRELGWLQVEYMIKEEFEKKIDENLKNAINDYKKEFEEIKKTKIEDELDLYLHDKKLKILTLKLIERITSENNAEITFINNKVIKGFVKYDDIEIFEFEIKFNS